MNKLLIWVGLALLVAGAVYYFYGQEADTPSPIVVGNPLPPATKIESGPPPIQYPVPEQPPVEQEAEPEPLPPLGNESDPGIHESLLALTGTDAGKTLGLADDFIRRFVTTADGLPEQKIPVRVRPIARAPGRFAVSGSEDNPFVGSENFSRYEPLVALLDSLAAEDLVGLYSRYYALLQEAYDELGYPDAYFNDRLVEVIDHLLSTPDVDGPIALARPHVLYTYADPELESLSAGQKLLLRVGPDNAGVIKRKLREIRGELVKPLTPGVERQ